MLKKTFLLISVLSFISILFTQSVFAQDVGLTVYPAIQDQDITAGQRSRVQLQFKNNTTDFIPGTVRAADFIVKDNNGTPVILEDTLVKSKYAAASWLTFGQNPITIPPHDFVTVDVFINVPQDVSTCGHYAYVYFQPATSLGAAQRSTTTKPNLAVTTKIGGLLNLKLQNTACKDEMRVVNFSTPTFVEFGPINTTLDLLNLGDVHVVPSATITLTNFLGNQVDKQKVAQERIFPEAGRVYTIPVGSKWMIGRYQVILSGTSNGAHNVPFYAAATVWVFPWRFTIIILLALLLFFLLGRSFYGKVTRKEVHLEEELKEEQEEIEKLKDQLRKRKE